MLTKPKNWDKVKLPRYMRLKHYNVFYEGHGTGCYAENYQETFLGDMWAVSEADACNKMRYSLRDDKHPNGGYSYDILGDCLDEGLVEFGYKAYEIKNEREED